MWRSKRQVGDNLFELGVFVPERPELAQPLQPQAAELFLPPVERLLANAEPAADLGDFLAPFDLVERVNDFLVAAAFSGHRLRLVSSLAGLAGPLRKSQIASFSPFRCTGSWGLGQEALLADALHVQ